MKLDFSGTPINKTLLQAKERFNLMLSFLGDLEQVFSKDGVIVFYKEKKFLIPYETLYSKATNPNKANQDIFYNLNYERYYKTVENIEEITSEEAFFNFLKDKKYFLHLNPVLEYISSLEEGLSLEVIFYVYTLNFSFCYRDKKIWSAKYDTLRDRYLKSEEKKGKLLKELSSKIDKIKLTLEKEKEKELKRMRVLNYFHENKLVLLDKNYSSIRDKVNILCSCKKEFTYHLNVLMQYNVNSCSDCRKVKSSLESFFEEHILVDVPYTYEFRKVFSDASRQEIDFYFPEKNLGIELNGMYWHSAEKKEINHLQKKKLYFLDRGINVLFFYENLILQKPELISSMVKAKLGIFKQIFYARKGKVTEIDYRSASKFFEENHISGSTQFSHAFGFFVDDQLISVVAFAKPRYNKNYAWELIRFANKQNFSAIGFLGKAIDILKPRSLISYADLMYSNGNIYEKLGFKKLSITAPGYFYTKNRRKIFSRETFQKHKLREYIKTNKYDIVFFDENLTEEENMIINKYIKLPTAGNLVYVKT
ncbi:MAG: hypothetical protein QXP88_03985 [Thermoproteota archaeon]